MGKLVKINKMWSALFMDGTFYEFVERKNHDELISLKFKCELKTVRARVFFPSLSVITRLSHISAACEGPAASLFVSRTRWMNFSLAYRSTKLL